MKPARGISGMTSPADIVASAQPGEFVVGWQVDPAARADLLSRFPPCYGKVVADHVTLAAKVAETGPVPNYVEAEIVGWVDDGAGVQALVVAIDGRTDRPGGGTYHMTWSLGEGRRGQESNDVLASRNWQRIDHPVPVALTPARNRHMTSRDAK